MMKARFTTLMSVMVVVALGLAACNRTNQEPSLFRQVEYLDGTLVTDAKQRIVFNIEKDENKERLICAEPSPDIAQAFSETLEIAEKILGSSSESPNGEDSQNLNRIFVNDFATSIAELGERLAVIQLFRDRMYRACEAYANGAIGGAAYTLMLARNDKTMATLLTAEMAAGAFGRPSARIGNIAKFAVSNPKASADLHTQISQLTNELKAIASSNDNNRFKKTVEISEKLTQAHTELLALDISTARIAASAGNAESSHGKNVDQMRMSGTMVLTGGLSDIHNAFLDDPGFEPLIDACLTDLSKPLDKVHADRVATAVKKIDDANKEIDQLNEQNSKIHDISSDELQGIIDANTFDNSGISTSEIKGPVIKKLQTYGIHPINGKKYQKSNIEELIQLSDKHSNYLTEISNARTEIFGAMLSEGRPFSGFCMTEVFSDLSERGYIKTMINSRSELRKIENDTKRRHLDVCEKMLSSELSTEQRTAAIVFCNKF